MTKAVFDYAKQRGTQHKIGQLNPAQRYGIPSEVGGKHEKQKETHRPWIDCERHCLSGLG